MKKATKCLDCQKNVDFVTALSTGLCQGCKNIFCFKHKFTHTCKELQAMELEKKKEQERLLQLGKQKKSIFSFH